MLSLAMQAHLPIVQVTTTDTLNVIEVLTHISGYEVAFTEDLNLKAISMASRGFLCSFNPGDMELEKLYQSCQEMECCLILVNTELESPILFDAGVVPVPKDLIREHLSHGLHTEAIDGIMPMLGGLTLKDIAETVALTMTRDQGVSPQGILETRRLYLSKLKGISQVERSHGFYLPPAMLSEWVPLNREFFLNNSYPAELTPRGLLFTGQPGTGKTQGAKYIAEQMNVPLYRLDLGSMMTKWVGESEHNLKLALAQVDQEEPCVMLLDEVEKIFNQGEDSGPATRMMGQLLWWLQEHQSKVLTIMTTNDHDAIPAELYREGRVDKVMEFEGLEIGEALGFVEQVLASLEVEVKINIPKAVKDFYAEESIRSQAALTAMTYEQVKKALTGGK